MERHNPVQFPKQVRPSSEQHLASQAIDRLAGPRPPMPPRRAFPWRSFHLHTSLCLPPHPPQVISQKEGDFFFDSLREVSDWVRKNKPQKEGKGSKMGWDEEGGVWLGWRAQGRGTVCLPGPGAEGSLGTSCMAPARSHSFIHSPLDPLGHGYGQTWGQLGRGRAWGQAWDRWLHCRR